MDSATLCLYRFGPLSARMWAFAQMGLARRAFARVKGIGMAKLCGSGTGEGFTPVPNTGVYGILATWPDHATARRALFGADIFRRYGRMAVEQLTIFATPLSARGMWDGRAPFTPNPAAYVNGPVAILTRATIRPGAAMGFWRYEPAISAAIGADPNVIFKIGIGEAPLLRQITFSIWPNIASMTAFARQDGPHARAIQAVRDGDWFSEELYARFRVDEVQGTWAGRTMRISSRATQSFATKVTAA